MNALLAAHCAATWALAGLIWTVQLVHYPLFAQVGAETFRTYHARHTRNITFIVAPLMAAKLLTAVLLFLRGAREPWLLNPGAKHDAYSQKEEKSGRHQLEVLKPAYCETARGSN